MSPVLWANFGIASRLLATSLRPRTPPLLVVSLPRSGSSWVGTVLGLSKSALYLREPISQTHLLRNKRRGVVFATDARRLPPGYAASAEAAFAALPSFPPTVVKYPEKWRLAGRTGRRLVVKEVNPLALAWLVATYRPRVIYLVRHPAAVAASFGRLGWLDEESAAGLEQRFSAQRLGVEDFPYERFSYSAWAEHGALQAVAMRAALEALASYEDHRVVRYEDLCADPAGQFGRLYDFAELEWDADVRQAIASHTELPEHNRFESYSTYRNSRAMIGAWKNDLPEKALTEIRDGFSYFEPAYYGPGDW